MEPGGHWAWADPAKVSAEALWAIPEPGGGLAVGTDPAGNALAIWGATDAIRVASRPAGGAYGIPTTLSPTSGEGPAELAVGLGGGGHAVALWTVRTAEPDPGYARRTVWAADRAPDGTWSAPYVLAGPDARHSTLLCGGCPDTDRQPAVAVDAGRQRRGRLDGPPGADRDRDPLGRAARGRRVVGADGALAAGGAGRADGHDRHRHGGRHLDGGRLAALGGAPAGAGAFGPARHLGEVSGYGSGLSRMPPSLTIDGEGRTLAVWTSGNRILAARSLNAGPWGEPADLSALTKPEPPKPGDPKPPPNDPTPKADLLRNVTLSHARLVAPTCSKRRRTCRAAGIVLGFRLEAAGEVRVIIQRRGKGPALRTARIAAGAGKHRVRLLASRPLPAGRYTVRIRASAPGWESDAASRTLLVIARR